MDSGSLYMLHDTWNNNLFSITYRINLDFNTHQVFIDKNWMFLCISLNNIHKFGNIFIRNSNLHTLSTKYIRWTNQYRVSNLIRCLDSFFFCKYCASLWTWNTAFLKNLIEKLSIFCCIYVLSTCTKNRHTNLI